MNTLYIWTALLFAPSAYGAYHHTSLWVQFISISILFAAIVIYDSLYQGWFRRARNRVKAVVLDWFPDVWPVVMACLAAIVYGTFLVFIAPYL
ncbi:hypothetical protein GCM10027347_52900 [Larkinella harenae]